MVRHEHRPAVIRHVFDSLDLDPEVIEIEEVEDVPGHLCDNRVEAHRVDVVAAQL